MARVTGSRTINNSFIDEFMARTRSGTFKIINDNGVKIGFNIVRRQTPAILTTQRAWRKGGDTLISNVFSSLLNIQNMLNFKPFLMCEERH